MDMMTPAQMAAAAAPTPTINGFPFQKTKADLDWAVFMYLFIFATVVGSIFLYRIFACCMARSNKDDAFV